MKHLKRYRELFESERTLTPEQVEWLDECTEGTWTLNQETGLVDVKGDFDCRKQNLQDFKGIRFGVVERNFICEYNSLTSLEGAPQKVGGDFYCGHNSLTSLEGAPQEVGGDFYCGRNPVPETTLKKIWNEMKGGFTYPEALRWLAPEIPKEDWDLLDKSGLEMDAKFTQGASLLKRFL